MSRQPVTGAPAPSASEGVIIPYDHAATFELTGRPGNIAQSVINVGNDGVFVAVAIGYGFEEKRAEPVGGGALIGLNPTDLFAPGEVTLGQLPLAALIEGFRISSQNEQFVFSATAGSSGNRNFSGELLAVSFLREKIFERVKPPEDLSFFFSIVDSGTGREFQDQPAHNLASLGKSNGERPFRLFARPLSFLPRSTLRLQVAERTEGARGTLFIVLYGYKILKAACGETQARNWSVTPQGCAVESFGSPGARAIPFDYVATFDLTGRSGAIIEDEISVNVEDGFIATSIGYGMAVEERGVKVSVPAGAATVDLASMKLNEFPSSALLDGIRIRPNFLRAALAANGGLANRLPVDLASKVFERLNTPEAVSFRYAIFDSGTGRELQNRPINNVAGLGIANGDRPFKKLARPMSFLPRSTIRVQVEERFGRGRLFIAFQGYKLIGAAPQGGRR